MSKQNSTLFVVILLIIVAFFAVSSRQPSFLGFATKNTQEAPYQNNLNDYAQIESSSSYNSNSIDSSGRLSEYNKESKLASPSDISTELGFVSPQPAPASRDESLKNVALQKQQFISALGGNGGTRDCREVPSILRKYLKGC